MSERNPFQPAPGVIPPVLVGREPEMAAIFDATMRLRTGGSPVPISLFGLRGLGKTVLLKEIQERTPDALHLEIEVEPGVPLIDLVREEIDALSSSVEPFRKRFGKAIDAALRHLPMPSVEVAHQIEVSLTAPALEPLPERLPLGRAIAALNEEVRLAGRTLVVTIDEVQDVDIAGFRSLVARVHKSAAKAPILLASAGLPQAYETFAALRTYARRWDRFELRFLTRAECAEAIRAPVLRARATIEDAALDLLVDEAAGYPYFVQRYASATWNAHEGRTITLADARSAIAQVRPMVEKAFYAEEFNRLTQRERAFVRVLAERGSGQHDILAVANAYGAKTSSAISSLRNNLIRKGIIYAPAPGTVQFRLPLAERYVLANPEAFPATTRA